MGRVVIEPRHLCCAVRRQPGAEFRRFVRTFLVDGKVRTFLVDGKVRTFRRTIKWRTGSEGRISTLKRGYGWDRTRIDGTEGTRIWTGHGVLTHNLIKISALAA